MEIVFTALVVVVGLVFAAGVALVLSAPLGALAIWHYSRTRRHLHLRSFLVSALNGAGQGLAAGVAGVVLGASVQDESAGEASLALGIIFLIVAGGLGFAMSYLLVLVGCKIAARKWTRR